MNEDTNKVYYCPIELSLDLIGSKWKPTLLRQLGDGVRSVGELRGQMPLVTRKTLDALLLELTRDSLVEQTLHSEERDREEYGLTDSGRSLSPILEQLALLGREYARRQDIELLEGEPAILADSDSEQHWVAWSWLPL